ncbi:hypothetical protein V8C34DRAFT_284110 [Trichoderma compactum]
MSEMVDMDWLRASGENAPPVEQRSSKQLEYDDWGQVCKNTDASTGVVGLSVTDQIALTRTVGIQGEGQTRTTRNLSGVPTQIELLFKDGTRYSQVQYRYDGLGRLVEEEDACGNKTVYESDAFDRVCNTAWPTGRAVEVQYATQSAAALPISVRLNGFTVGEQTFDGLDRLVQRSEGGRTMRQAYQSSGPDPVQITTQNRDTFALEYEPGLPHLLAKSVGTDGEDDYSYDPRTRVPLQLKSPACSLDRRCFPSGLLKAGETSISPDVSFVSQATYSMKGKLQVYKDVHAQEYCHEYDAAGRLSTLTLGTATLSYSYGPGSRVTGTVVTDTEHNTSLATALTHDDFGREVERVVSQGDQPLYRLTQSYGRTGLVMTRDLEDEHGTTVPHERFEYDVHSRLVTFTCTGSESHFPADENGQRIQQQQFNLDDCDNIRSVFTTFSDGGQDTATYEYNNEDDCTQLTQISHTHPPSRIVLAYNASGCLTRDDKGQTLTYDGASRLKSVHDSNGKIISQYDYDAAGRLIRQSTPDQPDTYLFYREDQLIGTQAGDVQTSYLADGNGYWGQMSRSNNNTTQVQLWAADGHGSILSRVKPGQSNETHQQAYTYTPYGYSPPDAGNASIAFNGQRRDPVTGWYHLGNGYRVYNPMLRRFHVPDPGSPFSIGEINPYAYCAGDPINRIDPSGQFSFFGLEFDWGDLVSAIVGLVVSVIVGVLTAGAGAAIEVGVGITAGVAANAATSPLADLAAGRKPTWKSVAISALNGLVDGLLGEAGGRLLGAGFKAVSQFKTLIGRAGSYTVNATVDRSLGATFRHAVKGALPSELSSHVAEGLFEIDPFPGDSGASPSLSANDRYRHQLNVSAKQQLPVLGREASVARDQIRLVLRHGQPTLSRGRFGQQSRPARGLRFGSGDNNGQAIPQSVAGILNRPLQCTFGPVGSSQGKRQTTGSGALEALEKKRQKDDALRNLIRQPASDNF